MEPQPVAAPTSGLGIGLAGAHRTGKTTIVNDLARINSIKPVCSSASAIAKEMGFSLTEQSTFADRLAFQERLLVEFDKIYAAEQQIFFSDRTPLDLAAYLIADIPNDLTDKNTINRATRYVEDCLASTERHFCLVTLIQPGIPYVAAPGKPLPNKPYQEAINTILMGLLYDDRIMTEIDVMPRGMVKHEERLSYVAQQAKATIADFQERIRLLPHC